jgi:(p)ppGpp synthase/HD superfamily hydrolase
MVLSPQFSAALIYAFKAHSNQVRKLTRTPYVSHVLAVCSLALENGADESTAIAALLHDVVEDCGGAPRRQEIAALFGERVAGIVMECSDTDVSPKPPWKARTEAYLAHLPAASAEARLVSCCDKLHNARCILLEVQKSGLDAFAKFSGGVDGTLWYYRELVRIYRSFGPHGPLIEELDRVVTAMESAVATLRA